MGTVTSGSTTTKTFVIQNAGPGTLKVRGISFAGVNASEFTLLSAPTFPLMIAASGNQSITVQFAPTATGARVATLKIENNDFSEGEFDFVLQGTSIPTSPEINIQGNSIDIAKGDLVPATNDNTDFGSVISGSTQTKTFTIQNTGTGSLSVTSIGFTGTNATEFTLLSAPTLPLNIAASGSQVITVQFAPLATGSRTSTLTIANSDSDEGTYDFALQGTATTSTGIQQSSSDSYLKLYPIPTGDVATISMLLENEENITVKVLDLEGRPVLESITKHFSSGEQQIILNTSSLQGGVYYVEVSSETTTTRIKAVVIH